MNYIKLEEAGKRYLSHRFTLEVSKDDFLVISGDNGSGKTTLLMLILGFIHPDTGKIEKRKLKMGYLPEKVVLPPFIPVMEYLLTMARIKKDTLDPTLLHILEVPLDKSIHQLSKGNQQKIAFISACMGKPHLLILDEPFSGLDEVMKEKMVELIEKRHHQGTSILISTHEPERFLHLATKHLRL